MYYVYQYCAEVHKVVDNYNTSEINVSRGIHQLESLQILFWHKIVSIAWVWPLACIILGSLESIAI